MSQDWNELTKLTRGRQVIIERVRMVETNIAIEGDFLLPQLAQLSSDDQAFVSAFVVCHGSIKQMEKFFGVSYPTIKNRLNRIGEQLSFVEMDTTEEKISRSEILNRLNRGELDVNEAIKQLEKGKINE